MKLNRSEYQGAVDELPKWRIAGGGTLAGFAQLDDQREARIQRSLNSYHCDTVMIKDIVSSESKFQPIMHTQVLCIDKDHSKEKSSAIEKPKKPKVPEDQV